MESYTYKRNHEGIHIINLGKTWEKLMLAARIIAGIPNKKDVLVSFSIQMHRFLNIYAPSFSIHLRMEVGRFTYRSFPTGNMHSALS